MFEIRMFSTLGRDICDDSLHRSFPVSPTDHISETFRSMSFTSVWLLSKRRWMDISSIVYYFYCLGGWIEILCIFECLQWAPKRDGKEGIILLVFPEFCRPFFKPFYPSTCSPTSWQYRSELITVSLQFLGLPFRMRLLCVLFLSPV